MPCGEVDEERKRKLVTDFFVPCPLPSKRASGLQIFSRVLERERFLAIPNLFCCVGASGSVRASPVRPV